MNIKIKQNKWAIGDIAAIPYEINTNPQTIIKYIYIKK